MRLYAVALMSALLAACGGGASTTQMVPSSNNNASQPQAETRELTSITPFLAQNSVTGETVRTFPTVEGIRAWRITLAGQRATKSTSPLLYHGGPIQTAPHIYVVFWGSAWNGSGDPDGVAGLLQSFYGVIGGSGWLNSVTQYTQSDGQHVGNATGSFAGWYVDTSSSPPRHPGFSALAAEASRAAAHFGVYSANAAYVVASPHGIRPNGFGTQYCAYHTSTFTTGGTIAWTNLPYIPDAGFSCGAGSVNSPGTLDGVTIVSGHEQGESETDPFPNSGWLDSSGAENGDKCAWIMLENNPNAGGYPTQPLWSNANSGCVQVYP